MTKSLNELHIALYEFLLSVSLDHVLDRVILGSRVHALVCSLLMAKCRVSNRIRHILDITIPMGNYKRDGIYRNANYSTQYCAWLQFCLMSVVIQASRLGGVEKSYVRYECKPDEVASNADDEDTSLEDLDIVDDVTSRQRKREGRKIPEPLFFVDEPGQLDESPTSGRSSETSGESRAEGDALLV